MGCVHFVGGEKGGVGKTVVAKLLAQLFIDESLHWVGFDADRSHGDFHRAYSDFVQRIDAGRISDLDRVVDALESGAREVVVDLASQSEVSLFRWLEVGEVCDFLASLGHSLRFWYVIDHGVESVRLLSSFLDRTHGAGEVVCVRNHGRARDFLIFEESKLRNRIEQRGGALLDLPELEFEAMRGMELHGMSFWAAVHNVDPSRGPCLSTMQRQRVEVFVRGVHAQLRGRLWPGSA